MIRNRHLIANFQKLTPQLFVSLALAFHSAPAAAEPGGKAQATGAAEIKPGSAAAANSPANATQAPAAKPDTAMGATSKVPAGTGPNAVKVAAPGAKDAPAVKEASKVKANSKESAASPTAPAAAGQAAMPATADTPVRAELDTAREAYTSGNYVLASEHYAKAQQLKETGEGAYFFAMSLDLQGKTGEAFAVLEKLIASPQLAELTPEQQQQAKQRLDALAKIPANLVLHVVPAAASLSVDGVPQAGAQPYSLTLVAGKHDLLLKHPGYENLSLPIQARPADSSEQSLELKPETIAAVAPPKPETPVATPPAAAASERNPVPAYVTLGVAGASAVVGAIFGAQALSAKKDFNKSPSTSLADRTERNALIADMAFGVALTLGITGVVLLVTDEPSDVAAQPARRLGSLRFAPLVSPTLAGAMAHLNF